MEKSLLMKKSKAEESPVYKTKQIKRKQAQRREKEYHSVVKWGLAQVRDYYTLII